MGRGHTPGSDWPVEQVELAAKLWAAGQSAGQIAPQLGPPVRTRNAVLGMMGRNRETFPKKTAPGKRPGGGRKGMVNARSWRDDEVETVKRMWTAKAPIPEIGLAIGRSTAAVQTFVSGHREMFPARQPVKRQPVKRPPRVVSGAPVARLQPDLAERFPPPPEAPECKPVTLMDRRAGQCAFPLWDHYGDKPGADSLYCGGDVAATGAGGGHYCAYHRALVYRPFTEIPRKDQPQRRPDHPKRAA